jgi:hypothetical protein
MLAMHAATTAWTRASLLGDTIVARAAVRVHPARTPSIKCPCEAAAQLQLQAFTIRRVTNPLPHPCGPATPATYAATLLQQHQLALGTCIASAARLPAKDSSVCGIQPYRTKRKDLQPAWMRPPQNCLNCPQARGLHTSGDFHNRLQDRAAAAQHSSCSASLLQLTIAAAHCYCSAFQLQSLTSIKPRMILLAHKIHHTQSSHFHQSTANQLTACKTIAHNLGAC